jgi:divalent metal cation (Fe/Co/Zn/Cd) transporter
MENVVPMTGDEARLYKFAFGLAVLTVVYNLIEGFVATYFGFTDESLALFGFGIDSFIEVISGVGIAAMVIRIQQNPLSGRDDFERTALRITGFAFYALVAGLLLTGAYNIWTGHKPETTFWGIVVAGISIAAMWLLILAKRRVGLRLDSEAILADAECTRVCLYMSIILLLSSAVYALTHVAYVDSLGTLGLAYLSFKEGRECFEKAATDKICACDDH